MNAGQDARYAASGRPLSRGVQPADWVVAAYNASLAVLWSRSAAEHTAARWLAALHLAAVTIPFLVARLPATGGGFAAALAEWYPLAWVAIAWPELDVHTRFVSTAANDAWLLRVDHAVFGAHLNQTWVAAMPQTGFSELLYGLYASYYLLMIGVPILIMLHPSVALRRESLFRLTLAYFACFSVHAWMPTIGPAVMGLATPESVSRGLIYRMDHFIEKNGDSLGSAFPSSHVAAAITLTWVAWRLGRRRIAVVAGALAVGIMGGTVYTQNHFAIDSLAGAVLALVLNAAVVPAILRRAARAATPTAALALLLIGGPRPPNAAVAPLENAQVRVEFGPRGMSALTDVARGRTFRVAADDFAIGIDGRTYQSADLPAPVRSDQPGQITYRWIAGPYLLRVVYALEPAWGFVSKQVIVDSASASRFRIDSIAPLLLRFEERPASWYVPPSARPALHTGGYGAAIRLADSSGVLAVVQNPFLDVHVTDGVLIERYRPDMLWRSQDGPLATDHALLAPYRSTGRMLPARMDAEWSQGSGDPAPGMDQAEIDAFTAMVRAFLLYAPDRPIDVFVGWCANDYQIDVATPAGRAEYERLIARAAGLGAQYVLFAPQNSAVSRREASVDDWSWEHVLWLGLGQQIRRGTWSPDSSPMPPSVQVLLDFAQSRNVRLLAYVYPIMPFAGDPRWLVPVRGDTSRRFADLGVREFQDWLIEELVSFHRRTGIGGYAFDHTFLNLSGTSTYAQWWGWRRVMAELRRRVPGIVIDGRQAYHLYGPWSWLAGSYPHPTFNDEQPESFVPFPDLHFDRVSADHERYTAYRYREYEFTPSELVPGFITHQTSRSDSTGEMPAETTAAGVLLTRFRARDWDYLGWRYSVLSSIAVAGWNNVLNLIPARDSAEDTSFSAADQSWLRGWLDWTVAHKELLRRTRPILGPPAPGKVDGTAAIDGDSGFIFLFNPNARRLRVSVPVGAGAVRELYPDSGRRRDAPDGTLALELAGASAVVLEIRPRATAVTAPVLIRGVGVARLDAGLLRVDGERGEMGSADTLRVVLPTGVGMDGLRVNGTAVPYARRGDTINAVVRFAGTRFTRLQQVGAYDSKFAGGTFHAAFSVPSRVFAQLANRRRAWPISWTRDDSMATWLVPERLLLFVQIDQPDERWSARMTIDGHSVALRRAYSSIRPVTRDFVGFYADVSWLTPDRLHRLTLELPALPPGRFQGVFFENVEAEYTDRIVNTSR
jgi:hypothetical protein